MVTLSSESGCVWSVSLFPALSNPAAPAADAHQCSLAEGRLGFFFRFGYHLWPLRSGVVGQGVGLNKAEGAPAPAGLLAPEWRVRP